MSTNREALRTAIAAVDKAESDLAKCSKALERSRVMLAAAEQELSGFADLDGKIAAHRSSKLKAAIAAGDAEPDFGVLPKDLQALRTKRGAAVENAETVRSVTAELEADRERAAKAVEQRKYELDLAVEKVIGDEAASLAEVFLSDFDGLCEKHRQLAVFLERRIRLHPDLPRSPHDTLGGYRQMEFPRVVYTAVQNHNLVASGAQLASAIERTAETPRALVSAFIQRLRSDADAKFD